MQEQRPWLCSRAALKFYTLNTKQTQNKVLFHWKFFCIVSIQKCFKKGLWFDSFDEGLKENKLYRICLHTYCRLFFFFASLLSSPKNMMRGWQLNGFSNLSWKKKTYAEPAHAMIHTSQRMWTAQGPSSLKLSLTNKQTAQHTAHSINKPTTQPG